MTRLNTVIELLRAMQADTPDDVLVVKEWLDGREVVSPPQPPPVAPLDLEHVAWCGDEGLAIERIKGAMSGAVDSDGDPILWSAFSWACSPQGFVFWSEQTSHGLNPKGRAILLATLAHYGETL